MYPQQYPHCSHSPNSTKSNHCRSKIENKYIIWQSLLIFLRGAYQIEVNLIRTNAHVKKINKLNHRWLVRKRESYRLRRIRRSRTKKGSSRPLDFLPKKVINGRTHRVIVAPSALDLSAGYLDTITFFGHITQAIAVSTRTRQRLLYVDLTPIKSVSSAGALLLASYLHRWRLCMGGRKTLSTMEVHKWDPEVRSLLRQMGLYDLLGVNEKLYAEEDQANTKSTVFLKFYSGTKALPELAVELRTLVESAMGRRIKSRVSFVDALSEAMLNAHEHAYMKNDCRPVQIKDRWWISAGIDRATQTLTVMCFDQGVGIPTTLPRSGLMESARRYMASRGSDDASMIEAAVRAPRTKTMLGHRGKGLREDILRWAKAHDSNAELRILSNRGEYRYSRSRKGTDAHNKKPKSQSIGGTFIEWTFRDFLEDAD